MQYIKDKKFDLADQTISKLESMKTQLPQAVQDGLAKAKTALAEAKKAAGL
jgi:hypothetical protein